jgi:hypothetical protein
LRHNGFGGVDAAELLVEDVTASESVAAPHETSLQPNVCAL